MTEFQNIWLSSIDHLTRFMELAKKRDGKKLIKQSNIPKVRVMFDQYPVIFTSKGNLTIDDQEFIFSSSKQDGGLFKKYHNLITICI